MKKKYKEILAFAIILSLLFVFIGRGIATNSGSSDNANLTIWDDTDLGQNRYSQMNVYFEANYTNLTDSVINSSNGNGNCTIRFNETGTWTNWDGMSYNETSFLWQYNRTFNYKGIRVFEANCTSNFGNISISDNFTISNTAPSISRDQGGSYIDLDGNKYNNDYLNCYEDSLCTYNFSTNVTEIDINDILTYDYIAANTTLVNFTFSTSTSNLTINVTLDANTGNKQIELTVRDTESSVQSGILRVNITAVNDAPRFLGLENWTINSTEASIKRINITDEENNTEFTLNITFIECTTAEWSDRNSTNCTLFTSSSYSFFPVAGILFINFSTAKNDVGSYIVNLSVTDNNTIGNKTTSEIVNITIANVNQAPVFTYICNNERTATEDSEFTCWINATDTDEFYNLTFSANYSWFTFNETGTNIITKPCNGSTGYNASALVNFTARDSAVGNWSVNISVRDIGTGYGAPKANSTVINFLVSNLEDTVILKAIGNYTIYENLTFYINASDDDLLIPDHNIKNEVLTFASNTSWISVSSYYSNSNYTTAKVVINYDLARSTYGVGNHTVKINVSDTGGNSDEETFIISLGNDTPVQWNSSMSDTFIIFEDNATYLNFSQNVTDSEGDPITFSYTASNSFSSFSISSIGIINFTAIDEDVGFHNVTANASDGMLNSLKSFNFTVYNINDLPYLQPIQSSDVINASVDSEQNINCTEDNLTTIGIWTQDNDFRIPSGQRSFYNESHILNLTIEGVNTTLFNFSIEAGFPIGNLSKYNAVFTPKKADIGQYNITINITDRSNATYSISFNLTILSINHNPELMNLTNASTTIGSNFYYRINAADTEDGDSTQLGNNNFTFSYAFNTGANIFNQTTFNSTTGEINITFNSSQGGSYHINITVNDSSNSLDTHDFWIYVYDVPNINYPLASYEYEIYENNPANFTFTLNDSIGNNLTYKIYIEDSNSTYILRYNVSYYGNDTNLTWTFIPNFTEETYEEKRNITLIAYPLNFTEINISRTWNLTINHTNAPIIFYDSIDDAEATYGHTYNINLSYHFSDIDFSDFHYNQSANFTIWSNSSPTSISWNVSSDWILSLFSSVAATELLTINASDLENGLKLTNTTSNSFQISFVPPEVEVQRTPSGGGGASATTPVSLKIIFPDTVDAFKKDRIEIPITLENTGSTSLYKINLTSLFKKNNETLKDIRLKFSQDYFDSLEVKEKKNTTLTIDINTEDTGSYEVLINATSQSPRYSDWGIIHLNVRESNKSEVNEKLLFTEEFIAENPECIEIKEVVDEAWALYYKGEYENALSKAREAIDSCRYAISQPAIPRAEETVKERLYKYLSWTSLILFVLLILYYIYNRLGIKRGWLGHGKF